MYDLRPIHPQEVEASSNRSKVIGAAVVIVGLGALGAYSFASGSAPQPVPTKIALTQVRTTPEYAEVMPPPVSPVPLNEKPVSQQQPKPKAVMHNAVNDEAAPPAVHAKQPVAPPAPLQTPPENAAPQQDLQPSGPPDQSTQHESQQPDANQPQ